MSTYQGALTGQQIDALPKYRHIIHFQSSDGTTFGDMVCITSSSSQIPRPATDFTELSTYGFVRIRASRNVTQTTAENTSEICFREIANAMKLIVYSTSGGTPLLPSNLASGATGWADIVEEL